MRQYLKDNPEISAELEARVRAELLEKTTENVDVDTGEVVDA